MQKVCLLFAGCVCLAGDAVLCQQIGIKYKNHDSA